MNFLSRFKSQPAMEMDEASAEPLRRRTFSAAQYRDAELTRAAEARAENEAAEAAARAAAEEARAQRLAEAAALPDEGYATPSSVQPPMDWEEAVGWLSMRSAEARSLVAQNWNWEHDLRVLQFLVTQPDVDMGVAAGVFWLTGATDDFFPWGDDENPEDPQFQRAGALVKALGRRFGDDDFTHRQFGFDDSWDCSGLKERLEALYCDGRIEWSPANLPTVSPGPVMTMADVPEEERGDVAGFLSRHGV